MASRQADLDLRVALVTPGAMDYRAEFESMGIYNASALVIDNESGAVVAAAGNLDFWDHDHHGQVIGFKTVRHIIKPARRVWKTEPVLVRAGYYETVYERVCGQLRTTKVVYEKVLVRPGHWVQPRVTKVRHRPRLHRILRPHRLHRAGEDEWRVALSFGW